MQQSFDRDLLIVLHDVAPTLRARFDQKARPTHPLTLAPWIIPRRPGRRPGVPG